MINTAYTFTAAIKKTRGFSLTVNYTDQATAAWRQVNANFSG
jgi:hypothetical protein